MGADLFRGIGYSLGTAGKTVGKGIAHGFKYANQNIPGGFRGAAVRILTQDPLAGHPEPQGPPSINAPQPTAQYEEQQPARAWTGGQASGDASGQVYGGVNRSAVPSRLWQQQPPVMIPTGTKRDGTAEWFRQRMERGYYPQSRFRTQPYDPNDPYYRRY